MQTLLNVFYLELTYFFFSCNSSPNTKKLSVRLLAGFRAFEIANRECHLRTQTCLTISVRRSEIFGRKVSNGNSPLK